MPKALVARGTIRPGSVFVQPRSASMSYSGISVTWNGIINITRMTTKTTLRPRKRRRARA